MNKKWIVIGVIVVLALLSLIIPASPYIYRRARTTIIYNKYENLPYNSGAQYMYSFLRRGRIPWGINKTDLNFLITNRLVYMEELSPSFFVAELREEEENYLRFDVDFVGHKVFYFYFNTEGKFYRAVEFRYVPGVTRERHNRATVLHSFLHYNERWIGKHFIGQTFHMYLNEVSYEVKWRNDEFLNGYEQYNYILDCIFGAPFSLRPFLREHIDIDTMLNRARTFDEYPGLEIYSRYEFKGMLIESFLKPDPDDPSMLMRKEVHTSTYLTDN